MSNRDWFFKEEDEFGEALHRRTEELYSVQDALEDGSGFITCPAIALRDLVIFPRMVSPVFVGRQGSLLAIEEAQLEDQTMIALLQDDPDQDDPGPGDFYPIAVEIAVGRLLSMPDGSSSALVQGRRRLEIVEYVQEDPFLVVRARRVHEATEAERAGPRALQVVVRHGLEVDETGHEPRGAARDPR